jgi:lipopolysaccharide export LptBFGC system permease protein LptF
MVTLHGYILRELLKSFGLTVLALTALFTMGGGLSTVIKFEGVTAGDIFVVLPLLIPIVVTLTMPIAALFATTMTYGRLAADNELVAARAAGINVHRLFLSASLLSVFVALFTVLAVNLVIPQFMRRIEHFALTNVRDFAFNHLLQRGFIQYAEPGRDHYTLTAQQVLNVAEDQLIAKGFEHPGSGVSYLWVEQPTFLMSDKHGQLKRFSVADGGLVQFDTRDRDVKFTLYIKNARDYEVGKTVVQIQNQKIGPYARELPFSPKPSMLDLKTLRRWSAAPWEAPKLGDSLGKFLAKLGHRVCRDLLAQRLADGATLVLYDEKQTRYEITAVSTVPSGQSQLVLSRATVTRLPAARDPDQTRPPTRYEAPRAKFTAETSRGATWLHLELSALADQPVRESVVRAEGYGTQRERESVRLENLLLPQYVSDRMQQYTPVAVLESSAKLPTDADLQEERSRLQNQAAALRRKIASVIHFRMSFASSTLVTILMGAALGVIFRGSRALAAFGLACIPFATVAILISMGKQMTENESTRAIGPMLIWGGLALVAVADFLILRFGVRR